MSAMEIFRNDEFAIEVEMHSEDGFRVHAAEVAKFLGFAAAKDMLRTVPQTDKGWEIAPTPGGEQHSWFLTEAGFYRVLGQRQAARVKNEVARGMVERFQSWIFGEVLPDLRKRNSSPVPAQRQPEQFALPANYVEALRELAATVEAKEVAEYRAEVAEVAAIEATAKVSELEPLAAQAQGMIDSGSDLAVGDAAKALARAGVATGRNRLMKYLREINWVDRTGHPYQAQIQNGRLALKISVYDHPHTNEPTISSTVRVTGKGLAALHRLMTGQVTLLAH